MQYDWFTACEWDLSATIRTVLDGFLAFPRSIRLIAVAFFLRSKHTLVMNVKWFVMSCQCERDSFTCTAFNLAFIKTQPCVLAFSYHARLNRVRGAAGVSVHTCRERSLFPSRAITLHYRDAGSHDSKLSHSQPPSVADIRELLPAWVTSKCVHNAATTAEKQTWKEVKIYTHASATHLHQQARLLAFGKVHSRAQTDPGVTLRRKMYGIEGLDNTSEVPSSANLRPLGTSEEELKLLMRWNALFA